MQSTVSVVIPAYNAGVYITRALESVQRQTHRPDEVIVIDDGSTDNTGDLVKNFSRCSGLRITLEQQENRGLPSARNLGIRRSSNDLILFLDADDTIYPEFLEFAVRGLDEHAGWVACFSDRDIVDKNGNFIKRDLDHPSFKAIRKTDMGNGFSELSDDELFKKMAGGNVIPMTIVCRRSDVNAINGFDEELLICEDRLFLLKLMKRGKFGYFNKPLGIWQWHDTNLSGAANASRRYFYYDLVLKKLVNEQAALGMTAGDVHEFTMMRNRNSSGWMYSLSSNGSAATFWMGIGFLLERRITLTCYLKSVVRCLTLPLRRYAARRRSTCKRSLLTRVQR